MHKKRVVADHDVPNSNIQFKRNVLCEVNEHQQTVEQVWSPAAQTTGIKM